MRYVIEIPDYEDAGFTFTWEPGHRMKTFNEEDGLVITGNRAGLISLASQLLALAMEDVPDGYHFHHDDFSGGLLEGSVPLVFVKDKDV